jgi:stage V sporulation protein G
MQITKVTVGMIGKGKTSAIAAVALDDTLVIRSIRVVSGKKGPVVSMPQYKTRKGKYQDIVFPTTSELRKSISEAVLAEYAGKTA